MHSIKLPFIVTELAGPKVAGRVVKPGDPIQLTAFEARTELLAGVIRPAPTDAAVSETSEAAAAPEAPVETGEAEPKPARRR